MGVMLPFAGGFAAADGPLPFGDVVAGLIVTGAVIYDMCSDDEEEDKRKKNCQALKDSILNTCFGLTDTKRMACFEAANTAYRQCMGYE